MFRLTCSCFGPLTRTDFLTCIPAFQDICHHFLITFCYIYFSNNLYYFVLLPKYFIYNVESLSRQFILIYLINKSKKWNAEDLNSIWLGKYRSNLIVVWLNWFKIFPKQEIILRTSHDYFHYFLIGMYFFIGRTFWFI